MKMTEIVVKDAILVAPPVESKDSLIQSLVDLLNRRGAIPDEAVPEVLAGIRNREELGSTGIGRGVAIPHTRRSKFAQQLVAAAAVIPQGLDFEALDGEPVRFVFLVVCPSSRPSECLQALQLFSEGFRSRNLLESLGNAKTPEEVWRALEEADRMR